MSIGSFLFGSSGGVPKQVKRKLFEAYGKYADEAVPQDELDFIQQSVEPGFNRARAKNAAQYANADAPVTIGGRTGTDIALAGEEAGAIGGLTQEAKRRRQELRRYYLDLLMRGTYKQPSQGFIPSLAQSAAQNARVAAAAGI